MFASLMLPLALFAQVELADMAEVSMVEVVVEVAVVSAPLLSFLLHAVTASVATASIATLDLDTAICPSSFLWSRKNRSVMEAALVVLPDLKAKTVRMGLFWQFLPLTASCQRRIGLNTLASLNRENPVFTSRARDLNLSADSGVTPTVEKRMIEKRSPVGSMPPKPTTELIP
jgi:hypothetical protein